MSQLDLSRKRKRGDKVFKFKVFGARGYPAGSNGSFLDNIRALLEFGQVETNPMPTWSFQLEARRHPLLLFVVEEPVDFSCTHCRYTGWGHHMICNKNYHFLLPSKSGSDEYAKTNAIELHRETHTLHGVLHSNGFGHLLCINGGSGLPGYQIMEFWDRLCSGLGAREVSLRDSANKKGMELRLLHSVAYGRPWFGQWDYTFKRGSYGVDKEMYQNAIKTIQNVPLTLIAHQFGFGSEIQVIFCRYQQLSSHSLMTLGDVFHLMLELKYRVSEESSGYSAIMSDASCRWSPKRVEKAIHVVVEALKRAEFQWVSRQHVRDVARAYIGDTGLLDFVLKSLGNHMVGKYLVRRCLNPVTKVLEYCLEDVSRTFSKQEPPNLRPQQKISWAQLVKDLLCLYSNILGDHNPITRNGAFAAIHLASRVILDAKHLAKEYRTPVEEGSKKKIYCRVNVLNNADQEVAATPYHSVVVRSGATLDEVRREAERTFGETYAALRNMAAEAMRAQVGEEAVVRAGSKVELVCRQGDGEVYPEGPVVNCVCGARDDDGERMVSCDLCRAWQHTSCVRIPDHHAVPDIYLCTGCEQDILRFRCYATSTPI